jgi:hypothetical protein
VALVPQFLISRFSHCLRSMRLVLHHVHVIECVQVVNVVEIFQEILKVDLYTVSR